MSDIAAYTAKSGTGFKPGTVHSLSTSGVLPKLRLQYWNDVACSTFTQQTVDAPGRELRAEMQRLHVAQDAARAHHNRHQVHYLQGLIDRLQVRIDNHH